MVEMRKNRLLNREWKIVRCGAKASENAKTTKKTYVNKRKWMSLWCNDWAPVVQFAHVLFTCRSFSSNEYLIPCVCVCVSVQNDLKNDQPFFVFDVAVHGWCCSFHWFAVMKPQRRQRLLCCQWGWHLHSITSYATSAYTIFQFKYHQKYTAHTDVGVLRFIQCNISLFIISDYWNIHSVM